MPVETLKSPPRQPLKSAVVATPLRLRPKGLARPEFNRQPSPVSARPKQSAVERLEADKAKYVKSQVALSKQQPVNKPLPLPGAPIRPVRKTPTQPSPQQGALPLDLEHLSNLINGVNDGPSSAAVSSDESQPTDSPDTEPKSPTPPLPAAEAPKQAREGPSSGPVLSSPAKVRLKASSPGPAGSPVSVTVRRVDVIPNERPVRTPSRPQQFIRQPLHPMLLHSQFPLRPVASNLRLRHQKTLPLKPVRAPSKPDPSPASPTEAPAITLPPANNFLLPPASPAVTRLSSSSSRKRPSLTRSKSDMSDRCSRAGTELERFFNLCGLDPSELQELTASGSDIVSMTRFRSASAPGSECAGSERGGGDEEEGADATERAPYGVSVIERNARVIKWLYGLRQAKDHARSTNV
ncbi:protein FAM110A [Lampris incognitus]|uniref:protein FAM110A n=1 Tax=Lampris incognitus TaxID=2546036 RepID=UPI0024B6165D|nr:protein FAM110A [Lampris incognitus]XP_056130925.1 protein FAM110A [Lampris incognitus]